MQQQQKLQQLLADVPKCDLHPKVPSKTCRKCKNNMALIEDIKAKNEEDLQYYPQLDQNQEDVQLIEHTQTGDKGDNYFKIWGDSETCNINSRLRNNILNCQYFKELYLLKTYHEVIDEICKSASHAEPWAIGASGVPSSLFCCLYKLMLMKLTVRQVKGLIEYKLNPFVRCAGFLYIRYCCNPEYLWAWMRKYLLDDEDIRPSADHSVMMTIGEYVEVLLTNLDYYQTRLPRIPIQIDNKIKAKLLVTQEKRSRKQRNLNQITKFVKQCQVKAISRQDEEWHIGQIEKVEGRVVWVRFQGDETNEGQDQQQQQQLIQQQGQNDYNQLVQMNQQQNERQFVGGEEIVNLGEIELVDVQEEEEYNKYLKNALSGETNQPIAPSGLIKESDQQQNQQQKNEQDKQEQKKYSQKDKYDNSEKKHKHKHRHSHTHKHKKHHHRRHGSSSKSRNSKSSSSGSRSRSRSKKSSQSVAKQKIEKEIKPKNQLTEKLKEQLYLEEVKKAQHNQAVAYSSKDVARLPQSYKSALSGPLPKGTEQRIHKSPSPYKFEKFVEMTITKQEKAQEKPKVTLTAEQLAFKKELYEKYGSASTNQQNIDKMIGNDYETNKR